MELGDLHASIADLAGWSHAEKIKLFGWFLHSQKNVPRFRSAELRKCHEDLNFSPPQAFSGYFDNLVAKKELLRDSSGYRLESRVRLEIEQRYGSRQITIQVTGLLLNLPQNVPDLSERTFLDEALICYRHGAFRAAIVMTWNLTFHHLCNYVLKGRLADFNNRWQVVYPGHHRKGAQSIRSLDDFAEFLKESEVIEVCNSAGIVTKDIHKILVEKLGRRNSAAHPSSVAFGQLQAEAFIEGSGHQRCLKADLSGN